MADNDLRVLIVDDETWARRRIMSLLRQQSDIQMVGQCSSGEEAVTKIFELKPDLVILDVQMPGMDGFDVIEAVGVDAMPAVVFATAYDAYAVRAFETHAVDYLLKPFEEDRFRLALTRARKEVERRSGGPSAELGALIEQLRARSRHLRRIAVPCAGRIAILNVADISWCKAAGNYVALHVRDRQYQLRRTMKELQSTLDPELFVRVHRSAIVNLDHVRELLPWFHGEQVLVLDDDTRITIGRRYRDNLTRVLG